MTINAGIGGFLQSQEQSTAQVKPKKPTVTQKAMTTKSQPRVDFASLMAQSNKVDGRPAPLPITNNRANAKTANLASTAAASKPAPQRQPQAQQAPRAADKKAKSSPPKSRPTEQHGQKEQIQDGDRSEKLQARKAHTPKDNPKTVDTDLNAGTAPENEAIKPKKEGTISPKALKKLRGVFSQGGNAIEKSPVLALLAGRLEQLDPGTIPDLVTSNDFLSQAFEAPKVEEYLEEPQELGKLIEAIAPSDEIISGLQVVGLDLGQTLTPNQFLNAVGVDRQRVQNELQILKQNIQINDGLSPYMIRSARLRAQLGQIGLSQSVATENPETPGSVAKNWDENRAIDPEANKLKNIAAAQPSQPERGNVHLMPAEGSQNKGSLGPATAATSMAAGAAQSASATDSPSTGNEVRAMATPKTAPGPSNPNIDAQAKEMVNDKTMEAQTKGQASELATTENADQPKIRLASENPFKAMATKMANAENIQKTNFESNRLNSSAPLERATELEAAFSDAPARVNVGTLTMEQATPSSTASNSTKALEWMAENADFDSAFTPNYANNNSTNLQSPANQGLNLVNSAKNVIASNAEIGLGTPAAQIDTSSLANALERMALAGISSKSSDGAGGQGAQSDSSSQQSFGGTHDSPLSSNALQQNKTSENISRSFAAELDKEPEANVNRADLVKRIADKAEMMIRDRGGAMKIEFGNNANEKIEVAFQVEGNKLELKILTANNEMREALNQHMPQLKEALARQDLNLTEAEVGVNNGGSSLDQNNTGDRSASMTDSERKEAQWQREQNSENDKQMRHTYNPVSYRPAPQHHGQIEIRV